MNRDKLKLHIINVWDTFIFSLFSIIVGLLPFIFKLLNFIVLRRQWISLKYFLDNYFFTGELYIFSIAYLAPSVFILFRYRKKGGRFLEFWCAFSIIVIILIAFLYAIYYQHTSDGLNMVVIQFSSSVAFIFTCIIVIITNYIQKKEINLSEQYEKIKNEPFEEFEGRKEIENLKSKI